MTHLFLAIAFWSISVGHASEEILSSLKQKNFECSPQTLDGCTYSECLGKLPHYPRPVLITVPLESKSLRVHFHGHVLGQFPEYETSLTSMIKAFGIKPSLCKSSEVTVFPASIGKCATYDKVLVDTPAVEKFMKELHSALGHTLSLQHVSAHSGGGRTVSRFLKTNFPIQKVTIFDGTYSESDKLVLKNWYEKSEGTLILATVKGMSPETYATQLKKELKLNSASQKIELNGSSFDVFSQDRFIHLSRSAEASGSLAAHYQILTQTWPFPLHQVLKRP